MNLKSVWLSFVVALLMSVSSVIHATTLDELVEADKVAINVWLEPSDDLIARQQIKLQIEVATDKWFSGGTRVGRVEVKDAIVLQKEKFALNSTRVIAGKSWAVQQWTLVIYPQRGGQFVIPSIPVTVSISGDNHEAINGQLNTESVIFSTRVPEALLSKESWVATTEFAVDEQFNKPLLELTPGDAVIRTVNFTAKDLPAMMLPKLEVGNIEGLAVYQKPSIVNDSVNRGDYKAERTEVLTYVVEASGDYVLPAQTFYWWNLASNSLGSIVLPAHNMSVLSGTTIAMDDQPVEGESQIWQGVFTLKLVSSFVGVLLIVWWSVSKVNLLRSRVKDHKSLIPTKAVLRRRFNKACRQQDYEKAMSDFYQWLDLYGGEQFNGAIRQQLNELDKTKLTEAFNNIMREIYRDNEAKNIDLKGFADNLFKELKISKRFSFNPIKLKLN